MPSFSIRSTIEAARSPLSIALAVSGEAQILKAASSSASQQEAQAEKGCKETQNGTAAWVKVLIRNSRKSDELWSC
jgi:hypothetical protein